ncbi:MAG: SIR2 family protein, partial [Nitrososphaera sp.]|nr:SIR2 family protein [Nitrososphaera sp.]
MGTPKTESTVLREYTRPIVHLRSQYVRHKLGLVFGAGLSEPLGFPNWNKLVKEIAKDGAVQGNNIVRTHSRTKTLTSITQMLYHKYQKNRLSSDEFPNPISDDAEKQIHSDWLRIVHRNLYCMDTSSRNKKIKSHPYIGEFIEIIKRMPMTVNYNFDDSLQKLMAKARNQDEELKSRGYETVWDSRVQFRQENSVIFHPNGFMSQNFNDESSGSIIFSDETFGDQLIQTMVGGYTNLVNHLSRTTCLFIGISLDDSTLKHLLRQNANTNPGHYHYIVRYTRDDEGLPDETVDAIFRSNFEVYNLITLFLGDRGIRSLARLIKLSGERFEQLAVRNRIRVKFSYYLIGCVGIGKSTTISHVRSLCTYDEWLDERPQILAIPPDRLSKNERRRADNWIANQFYKKNWSLMTSKEGIHVIDRTPLDPLTFTEPD